MQLKPRCVATGSELPANSMCCTRTSLSVRFMPKRQVALHASGPRDEFTQVHHCRQVLRRKPHRAVEVRMLLDVEVRAQLWEIINVKHRVLVPWHRWLLHLLKLFWPETTVLQSSLGNPQRFGAALANSDELQLVGPQKQSSALFHEALGVGVCILALAHHVFDTLYFCCEDVYVQ